MKKIALIALALFLVACSPSNETKEETLETNKESVVETETGSETATGAGSEGESGIESGSEGESGTESGSEGESDTETVEELTSDELILADIAKAEVEYYGLEKYYSRARIFNMLTSEGDTAQTISEKVANYAINKANIDFKKNALSTASIYAYDNWWDWEYIEKALKEEDLFTEEEVKYAMDNLADVDY